MGTVRNLGSLGVEIIVDGNSDQIHKFLQDLTQSCPPLSEITDLKVEDHCQVKLEGFKILESDREGQGLITIPPDVATCNKCLEDITNDTRYRGYWATSCVNCGPRFTVIYELPYDRERTSMKEFKMCEECLKEFKDPLDRRYHAQTIACPKCGPKLLSKPHNEEPIKATVGTLKAGKIAAIKGLGGFHLACDATNEETVLNLRHRLGRSYQPFAVMATEEMLPEIASVSKEELKVIKSFRRPIVVLRKRENSSLAPSIAPGLHTIGIMLPYTALHQLIFTKIKFPLVMTSANLPGQPMVKENEEATEKLEGIADVFLLHNRRIVSRCDDSVVRLSGGGWKFLRRSRGWAPAPLEVKLNCEPVLALGPELDVTIALYAEGKCYISQHVGNVDDVETYDYLREVIKHLLKLTGLRMPRHLACDLHPRFLTTKLAEEMAAEEGALLTKVQHHHAHIAKVMGEHGLKKAVGIALDGVGYGTDGGIWGGEVLIVDLKEGFKRAGGLSSVPMPGGDLATRHPARMVAGILSESRSEKELMELLQRLELEFPGGDKEMRAVIWQLKTNTNVFTTTSAGRFLDAVSALLGICSKRTYEGEPAMKLEGVAVRGKPLEIPLEYGIEEGRRVLKIPSLFRKLLRLKLEGYPSWDIAATAQEALAKGVSNIAIEIAKEERIRSICLSGGVAYNDHITKAIKKEVKGADFEFYTNEKLPCGDGGISFGQIMVAGS